MSRLDVESFNVQWLQANGVMQRCLKKNSDICAPPFPIPGLNSSAALAVAANHLGNRVIEHYSKILVPGIVQPVLHRIYLKLALDFHT